MGLEAGGYAEKFGNRYEAHWVALQYLLLLEEKITSVTVEPIGDDEEGVDVIIETHTGDREFHQCKASRVDAEYWTLSGLNQAKILTKAQSQIGRGTFEFHVVSPLPSKLISDLGDSALNTNQAPEDFYEYQIKPSQGRLKSFNQLCDYLGLTPSNPADLGKAICFLQKFKVTLHIIDKRSDQIMEDKAAALFSGAPSKLISFLKNYPVEQNKLRHSITLTELLKDLQAHGFERRMVPEDSRISPVIASISTKFTQSIKPFLIGQSLIQRPELAEALQSLGDYGVTLIKAEAGMGKSALLLEIHEYLEKEGAISVPIRLDRTQIKDTADAFGEKLGLPYSPSLCLSRYAAGTKVVIILDQLDAIRWTATHSNQALQVCQEMVRQVLSLRRDGSNISIILACRNFDLEEDVALASWIRDIDQDVSQIGIEPLTEETITGLIKPYEDYGSLSEQKRAILTIPLWLNIYLMIATRIQSAPDFTNKLELVKRFWEDRLDQVSDHGITSDEALGLLDEVVVLMTAKSSLAISENLVTISSGQAINALISIGVLSRQGNTLSFRHQALFDYQVGKRLFDAARISPSRLIEELGPQSKQSLTAREHLKYALNMLLDYGQSEFCQAIDTLLTTPTIRFHLKYLAFSAIRELKQLKRPAQQLIDKIMADEVLAPFFVSLCCHDNALILMYLAEQGYLANRLTSDNEQQIDDIILLLRSIAEKEPEWVLNTMSPYIGQSELWNRRVYLTLPWGMENDTDKQFETRKQLIAAGCNANFIQWKILSRNKPHRALDLIEMMLLHYKEALCERLYGGRSKLEKLAHRDNWSESEIKEVISITEVIPKEAFSRLLATISALVNDHDKDEDITDNWLHKDQYSGHDPSQTITHGIFAIIEQAAKQMADDPDSLQSCLAPYLSEPSMVINHLMARSMQYLPIGYADQVIEWLLELPKVRFHCGNTYIEPEWLLPGVLIEKYSPHCSEENFKQLEKSLYFFGSTLQIDDIKWRLEARRDGSYYSFWGETQHFLLPKLCVARTEDKTRQLMAVLQRKFETYAPRDFSRSTKGIGGMVTSPLPPPNTLSDKAWKKLILNPPERFRNRRWKSVGDDLIAESSIDQFSRSLDAATRNQPERFARLALSLPADIPPDYITWFYYGLSETATDRVHENYQQDWVPCEPALIEAVIAHFGHEVEQCEHALVRLLESHIQRDGFSDSTLALLINLAVQAKQPEVDKLNVTTQGESNAPAEIDTNALRSNAINSTRGMAYCALSKLFWDSEEKATQLRGLIQAAMDDPHPAVNITAVDMLLPTVNYDKAYATEKFLELCRQDLRMTCVHGAWHFFNSGFHQEHQVDFVALVKMMLAAESDEIKKEAAKQVFARWFFNDLFEQELEQLLHSETVYLEGITTVVAQFLRENKYHDKLHKIIPVYKKLVNAEDKEILSKVGSPINNENFWNKSIAKDLFSIFVQSRAAIVCLYDLFEALGNHASSLLNYQGDILALINTITSEDDASSELRDTLYMQETALIKVLQRLYDEAVESEDSAALVLCLDIWDTLLRSNFHSAINATKELEKGLLS